MSTVPVAVRIQLPPAVLDLYEAQARHAEVPLEDLLAQRLIQQKESHSSKPIVIDDEIRRQLEQLFHRNLSTSRDILGEVIRSLSVSIAGLEIPLAPRLLERLKSRAIRVDFNIFLSSLIQRLLEEHAGMR